MKKLIISAKLTLCACVLLAQTPVKKPAPQNSSPATATAGYNIAFNVTPYKNCWMYLGTYFGKNFIMVDSARANAQGDGAFKGKNKLVQGFYFIISPTRTTKLFDILVDGPQHFSVTGDSSIGEPTSITGSVENNLFLEYSKFLAGLGPKMSELQVQLKDPNLTKEKSDNIKKQLSDDNAQLNAFRANMIKNHPNSLMAMVFNILKMPDQPAKLPMVNGKPDSSYIGRFTKEHYWDDVAFNEDRTLHTPVFDTKLENYFKYYVSPDPDSIFAEANYMLLYSRTTKEMYHYLLGRFTDKYINPEIMGQNKVFLKLFENYFAKGDTLWLNASQRKYIFDQYYMQVLNVIGAQAPALDMVDTAGRAVSLYNIKAPFTFVVFWDPTCSHCKEQVPEVDSMYNAKWKAEGVKVFAVNVNEATKPEWKAFIADHHLEGWIHAWQTKEDHEADTKAGRPNFRQAYNIFQTPTMYLLDDQKHIVANKLSLQQFDGIIDAKLKKTNTAK